MAAAKKRGEVLAWLDIDIDGDREAFQRCLDFVATKNLTYSLSSNKLSELGGSEKARLPELYESDWEWSQKGRMLIQLPPQRVVIKLAPKDSPLAVENFLALCRGNKGLSKNGGYPLYYKGCRFHRLIKGFVAQGGDIATGTGAGGDSIWGKKFKDDKDGLKLKHSKRGMVGMCNQGKNSNGSQFFFTFAAAPKLDAKHVIIGEVVEGMEVLDLMEGVAAPQGDEEGKPRKEVIVLDCGVVGEDK